jgi:RES domain-containing protein
VLVYRVFPHREDAAPAEPGHPLYIHPDQGLGRWDNPDLYRMLYVASSATAAIGESFAHLSHWSEAMLPFPTITGSRRRLASYQLEEQAHPLLDLDDARAVLDRGLRPTDVVKRNRNRTQRIARDIFGESAWAGLSWWSMHRPEWVLHALWDFDHIELEAVDELPRHPGLHEAGAFLAKNVDRDLA